MSAPWIHVYYFCPFFGGDAGDPGRYAGVRDGDWSNPDNWFADSSGTALAADAGWNAIPTADDKAVIHWQVTWDSTGAMVGTGCYCVDLEYGGLITCDLINPSLHPASDIWNGYSVNGVPDSQLCGGPGNMFYSGGQCSTPYYDDCGACGWSGNAWGCGGCLDCANDACGVVDNCGVCGGQCWDICDGLGACCTDYITDGNGATCCPSSTGCDGICGSGCVSCDNNLSCCDAGVIGCDGICGSGCVSCDNNLSCCDAGVIGCDGVCDSGAVDAGCGCGVLIDNCGVCGGGCLDDPCDACGVCNGDNSSCDCGCGPYTSCDCDGCGTGCGGNCGCDGVCWGAAVDALGYCGGDAVLDCTGINYYSPSNEDGGDFTYTEWSDPTVMCNSASVDFFGFCCGDAVTFPNAEAYGCAFPFCSPSGEGGPELGLQCWTDPNGNTCLMESPGYPWCECGGIDALGYCCGDAVIDCNEEYYSPSNEDGQTVTDANGRKCNPVSVINGYCCGNSEPMSDGGDAPSSFQITGVQKEAVIQTTYDVNYFVPLSPFISF